MNLDKLEAIGRNPTFNNVKNQGQIKC